MSEIKARTMNCGSCGAPLEIISAYTKSMVCPYCDTTNIIEDQGLSPAGKMAKLSDAPGIFSIGRTGTLRGKKFEVLGRLRYGYDEGFWDEWFLQFSDNQAGWVTEEEGECTLFFKEMITSPIENVENLRVGQFVQVEGKKVFITEISDAFIEGGEGELHYKVIPGKEVLHIEGNASGKLVSIEVWPREIEVHTGGPVLYQEIKMNKEENPYN
ncbi:MAG: DUF4178 domain-containing protein [Firmicutes bacterium]|nr:DUF4178 domain-containing protein [Bacillota bacterium]